MAIAPNTTFVAGNILTAAQQNAFGFGVVALATSTTSYTLTTSLTITTGMTVTFTALANRNYKVTYYEPQVQTPNVAGVTTLKICQTNAAGTALNSAFLQTLNNLINGTVNVVYVGTQTAGSVTIVGCATASSTTGTPTLSRSATAQAFLIVEDIGPA